MGPNDGYVLLDAYLRAPGRVYLVHGVDHYLKVKRRTAVKMLALVQILLDELEAEAHSTPAAKGLAADTRTGRP